MPDALLKSLLSGTATTAENTPLPRVPIKRIMIEKDLVAHATDHIALIADNIEDICLVADKNTYDAMGAALSKALGKKFKVKQIVFADEVIPDQETADHILQRAAYSQLMVAVGSGTINDLVKYVTYLEGKPYIIYGTAPSMNGYASANASIIVDGHRKTLPAHLPAGIFLDTDVCSAAPKRLIASGVGDLMCRATAQADWLLSHLLLGTEYKAYPFEMLKPYEERLISRPDDMLNLCRALVVSGIGMYLAGGSYPASQGEHLIAHTMHMAYGDALPETFHGEEVAVATLTMESIQRKLLTRAPVIKQTVINEKALNAMFGPEIGKQCAEELEKKRITTAKAEALNEKIAREWSNIRAAIEAVMLPAHVIEGTLKKVDAPTTAGKLGWAPELYERAVAHAHLTRNRFTFLDLYNQ